MTRSEKMRAEDRKYFDEWRKEVNTYANPDIQKLSERASRPFGSFR